MTDLSIAPTMSARDLRQECSVWTGLNEERPV